MMSAAPGTSEDRLHLPGDPVVLLAHDGRLQNPGSGAQGVHRRINSLFSDFAAEDGGASRWEKVVAGAGSSGRRRDVHRLHGGDGPFFVDVIRSCKAPISSARVGW